MIHHLSIPAHEPKRVADVFAEVVAEFCTPFPPTPGSYMAFARDTHGTAIKVYPTDSVMKPNGRLAPNLLAQAKPRHSVPYTLP